MRIVFAGTPEFAAAALAALIQDNEKRARAGRPRVDIPLVLTQPDRPAGRGMKLVASPVRQLALLHGIAVETPATLSERRGGEAALAAQARLRAVAPDLLVVAAYGLILPQAVLDIPRGLHVAGSAQPLRAINIHASLLPRWRGAAPVARAIEAGDATTGVTLMQMEAGLDTGPMLLAEATPIGDDDTAETLTRRLAAIGAQLLVRALADPAQMRAALQPAEGVTYANKLDKREAWLDWSQPAARLARQVRAFDPFPVACAALDGQTIRLWAARAQPGAAPAAPGTVVDAGADGVTIACGEGALRVTELQRAGGRRLRAAEFLAGTPIASGARFVSTPPAGP
jgi:methionyl-tRNA formyltransferase